MTRQLGVVTKETRTLLAIESSIGVWTTIWTNELINFEK